MASRGSRSKNGKKSVRWMAINVEWSRAVAFAVRGRPSMTAISPNVSPGSMMLRNTSRPPEALALMRTRPDATPNNASPSPPCEKIVLPL
jgi:hypothetical protein